MGKGIETRQAILHHAMRLASQIGLEALSIGGLSQSLGLSKSGLFSHFKSKENLQIAVIDEAASFFIDSIVRPAIQKPRGEPRVRALFENWLAWASKSFLPGGCIFAAAAMEYDDRPGPIREHIVGKQEAWLKTMTKAIQIAIEEEHFRKDIDPDQLAFNLYGLLLASHHSSRLIGDPLAIQRARAGFEQLVASARPPNA